MSRQGKKEARKERAMERLEVTSIRTPEEQLSFLDLKFGKGLRATKERTKLAKRIADRNSSKTKE